MTYICRAAIALSFLIGPAKASASHVALILIDMQDYYVRRELRQDDPKNAQKVARVIERQRQMIGLAKHLRLPIVVVETQIRLSVVRGTVPDYDTRADLREEIGSYAKTITVYKRSDGAFDLDGSSTEVTRFLNEHAVDELLLIGANGGACVKCTIQSALEQGYRVLADTRGIIDFNDYHFTHPYVYRRSQIDWTKVPYQASFIQGDTVERFGRMRSEHVFANESIKFDTSSLVELKPLTSLKTKAIAVRERCEALIGRAAKHLARLSHP